MEWRRCGARQGFPEQLIILMIMMMVKIVIISLRVFVMIIMMIMIQRPFDFLDNDDGQDHDQNIGGGCEDHDSRGWEWW